MLVSFAIREYLGVFAFGRDVINVQDKKSNELELNLEKISHVGRFS